MRVLMVSSGWPSQECPYRGPFLVREVEALRKIGVDVVVFDFKGGFSLINYFSAWRRCHKLIRNGNFDLVHIQFGQNGLPVLFPKLIPMVVTFRGSDLNGIVTETGQLTISGFIVRKSSQIVAHFADEIILVSRALSQYLAHEKFHVNPGGIDLDLFKPIPRPEARKILELNPESNYILFVGDRNNPIKRFRLAQSAVEILHESMNAELLIAENIKPEMIPIYLNACNALLLTSIREGSPTIIREALACNTPIVSVDVGDVREYLKNNENCIVCDNDSASTIASALNIVLVTEKRIDYHNMAGVINELESAQRILDVYKLAIEGSKNG